MKTIFNGLMSNKYLIMELNINTLKSEYLKLKKSSNPKNDYLKLYINNINQ